MHSGGGQAQELKQVKCMDWNTRLLEGLLVQLEVYQALPVLEGAVGQGEQEGLSWH